MLLLGTALLAKHVVALPAPVADERLNRSVAALRSIEDHDKWLAVHVLYAECRCSQRIVAHLTSLSRPTGLREFVLWVGRRPPPSELAEHLRVKWVQASQLAQMGISAAPLLIVSDPNDQIRYVGGYSDQQQGPTVDELRIVARVREGQLVATYPLFGCAVSEELKQQLKLFVGL